MSTEINTNYNYHDLNSVKKIYNNSKTDDEAIQNVAKQMESVFLQMVVKNMRDANEAFESDLFNDSSSNMYQEMFDQQLTLSLSMSKGLGLAKVIEAQIKQGQK